MSFPSNETGSVQEQPIITTNQKVALALLLAGSIGSSALLVLDPKLIRGKDSTIISSCVVPVSTTCMLMRTQFDDEVCRTSYFDFSPERMGKIVNKGEPVCLGEYVSADESTCDCPQLPLDY